MYRKLPQRSFSLRSAGPGVVVGEDGGDRGAASRSGNSPNLTQAYSVAKSAARDQETLGRWLNLEEGAHEGPNPTLGGHHGAECLAADVPVTIAVDADLGGTAGGVPLADHEPGESGTRIRAGIGGEQPDPLLGGGGKLPGPVRASGLILPGRQVGKGRAAPGVGRCGGVAATVRMKQCERGPGVEAQDPAGRADNGGSRDRTEARCGNAPGLVQLAVCAVADVKTFGRMSSGLCHRIRAGDDGLHLVHRCRHGVGFRHGCDLGQRGTEDVVVKRNDLDLTGDLHAQSGRNAGRDVAGEPRGGRRARDCESHHHRE